MRWRALDQRNRLSIQLRIAHHEAGRNLHTRPAIAQDVDRQQRAAGDRVVLDAKVVVDARQRGIDGRGGRLWRLRICALAERAVFVNR